MFCNEDRAVILPTWQPDSTVTCVVDFSKNMMKIASEASCGKCVLCREGTLQVYEIIKDITIGSSKRDDYELCLELLGLIKENGDCELSQLAAASVLALMEEHAEEWEKHIKRNRCTNLVCQSSYTLYIDPELCDGCHLCVSACGSKAIKGSEGLIHVIETELCSKSLTCQSICPKGAIKKSGPVRPKLPTEPIPVGSFEGNSNEEEGDASGMRRRRRR